MPTALVLSLRPTGEASVALHLGRAAHAAFLSTLTVNDSALAERLHDQPSLKPFAVSDLLGARHSGDGRIVDPNQTYGLRWCSLVPELDAHLRSWVAAPPATVDLDGTVFSVEGATLDQAQQPWAGSMDWNALVGLEQVGRALPAHRLQVEFGGPTTFRSNGRNIPLPLPELVFGSLLDRWNAFAPITFPPDLRRFAGECLVLGRYRLDASWIALFNGGETAFTGQCVFTATNRDRYYLHCCAALLRFAFFSGIGAKTGMGFGMARAVDRGFGSDGKARNHAGAVPA
ncbi:MAG: CRISPR-associated endoribonuclease Cas6 [Burkholderiaceae bacterium]